MKNFNVITSKENSLIKLTSLLQTSSKARRSEGLFVLEGLRICDDAMQNGIRFDKLIISETAYIKLKDRLEELSVNAEECFKITDGLFKKISDTASPQGIIAIAKKPQNNLKIDIKGRYVILENINDPSNLGAVARTAEALGASGLILSQNGCDPYSPKSLRASMGTLLRMPIIIPENFTDFLKNSGLKIYACVVESDAEKLSDISFSEGSAVMIGNEANGLTPQARQSAYKCITIPMKGRAESLNAAVAASISIWEMMK